MSQDQSESSSEDSQNYSEYICNSKAINVITKDIYKHFSIDIIDKIDDPKIKEKRIFTKTKGHCT